MLEYHSPQMKFLQRFYGVNLYELNGMLIFRFLSGETIQGKKNWKKKHESKAREIYPNLK